MAIKLIVGLGNPGKDYQAHRHNAGFWFVEALAHQLGASFNKQSKFFGETSEALLANT
ncbi:MAG: aminoacyl-tRNA hydrolase, partial [Gammaproteobacteria bacterium]